MNFERPTLVPTVIDELRHLTRAELVRTERLRRDEAEARSLMALYHDCVTTTEEVVQ